MSCPTLAFRDRFRHRLLVLTALTACVAAACRSTQPLAQVAVTADTWAVVNGQPITRDQVEKAYRSSADSAQAPSDEEAMNNKLTLLNDLIVQEILMAKARELKIEVPESELDTA